MRYLGPWKLSSSSPLSFRVGMAGLSPLVRRAIAARCWRGAQPSWRGCTWVRTLLLEELGCRSVAAPHPAQPEPVSCTWLTRAPSRGEARTRGARPGLQAGALISVCSLSPCARELSLKGFWSRPHFGGWLIKMLSSGSWLVLSLCLLHLLCEIQRAEAP